MPIEITLHHILYIPFTVQVPDRCPHCCVDFTVGANLREWDTAEVQFAGHIDPRPDAPASFAVADELGRADVFRPVGFYCRACGATVHEAKSVLLLANRLGKALQRALRFLFA